jgi:hypothetical protein
MKTCPFWSNDAVFPHLAVDRLPVKLNSVAVTTIGMVELKEELALDVAVTW